MDKLGERLSNDAYRVIELRSRAAELERQAKQMRRDADEIERLAELARQSA